MMLLRQHTMTSWSAAVAAAGADAPNKHQAPTNSPFSLHAVPLRRSPDSSSQYGKSLRLEAEPEMNGARTRVVLAVHARRRY